MVAHAAIGKPLYGYHQQYQYEGDNSKTIKANSETHMFCFYKYSKQVHSDMGIYSKVVPLMNSFANNIFKKVTNEAPKLS